MKKNFIISILIIVVFVLGWFVFSPNTQIGSVTKQSHFAFALSSSNEITCTYPQTLHTRYVSGEIIHELPKPETNPIIMTFSDIQNEVSKIKFIDATQTISEVPVVKILDTADKLMFLEGSGEPYVTVHTIYKDTGVAIHSKQMSLLGIPVGTIAMGTCTDS